MLVSGQSGAISLGIARALQIFDPDDRTYLKKGEWPTITSCYPWSIQQCKLIQLLLMLLQRACSRATRGRWRGRSPASPRLARRTSGSSDKPDGIQMNKAHSGATLGQGGKCCHFKEKLQDQRRSCYSGCFVAL